jgi:NTP pyrophosphatase (non-canonical NTP hydrolase)
MRLSNYQRAAYATSKIHWGDPTKQYVPAFGAVGELGSLVAEIKKSLRDGKAYTDVQANLIEEFGDLFWYLAAIASHFDLDLEVLAGEGRKEVREDDSYGHVFALIAAFSDLVASLQKFGGIPEGSAKRHVAKRLARATQSTIAALKAERLSLDKVLRENLKKVRSMFGTELHPAPCFDADSPGFERLPRKLNVQFVERERAAGRLEVLIRVNDINIGDRLTDNAIDDDGYRFHDAFHLAYAAVLGWSPVIRQTFRCKRKSNPRVDEIQDGARAAIVEEAIAQTVFNYARGHSMLEGLDRLDYGVLKLIQRMVRGLEVSACDVFEWQKAIFVGYEAFRALRSNRGGWLVLDAETQRLTYSRAGPNAT